MIDRPDIYAEQDCYDYVRYITGLMRKTGMIKVTRFGEENLPSEGGYVLYPNHQGKFDAYAIVSAHDQPLSVVMDREMSYFGIVDEIIRILRGKRMDTKNARQGLKIINQVAEEVAQGRRYIIFPEGAYSNEKHNSLWEFHPGCFKAAMKAEVPVVPVVLVDTYRAYNSWQILPVKTQVHFLPPLTAEEYKGCNTYQVSDLVRQRIAEKLVELGYQP